MGRLREALQKGLKEICTELGPATDPLVGRRLVQWGLVEGEVKLPRELPRTLDAALALHAELGLDPELLGKPAKKIPSLPEPLAAFYARHDHLGSRAILPPGKLPALAKDLASWVRNAEEDAEEEDDEVDRRPRSRQPRRAQRAACRGSRGGSGRSDRGFWAARGGVGTTWKRPRTRHEPRAAEAAGFVILSLTYRRKADPHRRGSCSQHSTRRGAASAST